ncbi:hypothetical protein Mapa_003257 [Marchantia paleacea]|nr:hypothetical protein Mapa_003257 [Marchantia paleacea]
MTSSFSSYGLTCQEIKDLPLLLCLFGRHNLFLVLTVLRQRLRAALSSDETSYGCAQCWLCDLYSQFYLPGLEHFHSTKQAHRYTNRRIYLQVFLAFWTNMNYSKSK